MNFKLNTRTKWIAAGVALGCIALRCAVLFLVDFSVLHAWAEGLNPALLIVAAAVLPVFGFPTSVLHVIVGAKFGPAVGVLVTAFSVLINIVGIYWIASTLLARPAAALLRRSRFKLPALANRDQKWIALLTALLPGPYTVKNYLLSVSKVPLRVNLKAGWPVYVLRASSAILLGGFANELSAGRIAFLVCYGVIVALLCKFVVGRIKQSLAVTPVPVAA